MLRNVANAGQEMNGTKIYLTIGCVLILLSFFAFSVSPNAVGDEIYRWKDKKGNVFFSDQPPSPDVNNETIPLKDERPSDSTAPSKVSSPKTKSGITEEQRPYSSIRVIMYMTSWCGYCRKAREYLHSLRVNLVEYDVEKDPSKEKEMLTKSGGTRGVPLIDVEGIIIRGYGPSEIKNAIEKRRSS
jgi:glutaredoxin